MFDNLTIEALKYYVYVLIDPRTNEPFYIGKGKGNRVFEHVDSAINSEKETDKLSQIREIRSSGLKVKHVILRHGLSEDESFKIESSLIDFMRYFSDTLTNEVFGQGTSEFGVLTASEIIGRYNAKPLEILKHEAVIININKTYERAKGGISIYNATKEAWVISEKRRGTLQLALSEYRGIIVEVFEILNWYKCITENQTSSRWGFNGTVSSEEIRMIYLNRSVRHTKKKGAANPIRYKL